MLILFINFLLCLLPLTLIYLFMKNLLFILCAFYFSSAVSQIKVLETKSIERLGRVGENDIYIQKDGNEYTFFYKNFENKESVSYRNFSFKDLAGDYENFYSIVLKGFEQSNLQDIKLEMPDDYVWLHYTRSGQRVLVQFMTTNKVTDATGISDFLDVTMLNKLFGKS